MNLTQRAQLHTEIARLKDLYLQAIKTGRTFEDAKKLFARMKFLESMKDHILSGIGSFESKPSLS